jgi:hypothetical protein
MKHEQLEQMFPFGSYCQVSLPHEYDWQLVENTFGKDFACGNIYRGYRTWFVPIDRYLEFMGVIDSGKVSRYIT